MEIDTLIDTLEDIIDNSATIPVFGKCLINKEELLEIVKDIRLKLPDEIKQAKWVKEERQRILMEAQKEASNIIQDTENRIIAMVNEHEITKKAYAKADEIVQSAQKTSKEIKVGTRDYADDILARLEDILKGALKEIASNRKELK